MSATMLWSGLELVTALGARAAGGFAPAVSGISIDTRTLAHGDLFFAIKGENSDGHDYVRTAFERGAGACVIDEDHADGLRGAGPILVVRDVLQALECLGRASRLRSQAAIAAVTGSVGKTGTKEMLRLVLSQAGECHASAASYNNHWGVPLTLARMSASARFGVFEIGMNHPGEITPLTKMVRPHAALVTTVAPVHLEAFTSVDEIADAKGEIFSGLEPHGVAIIHRDIPQYERLRMHANTAQGVTVLSFGADENAQARLMSCTSDGDGSIIEADVLGDIIRYRLGAPGRHLAMNSLAVLLAARALGLEPADAAASLAQFSAPQGRGARKLLRSGDGDIILIDESYNANPVSMRAALDLLGSCDVPAGGRRIAVVGDMLELGPSGADLHAGIAQWVSANKVDLVFAAGPLSKHLYDALEQRTQGAWAQTSSELIPEILSQVHAGDAVMIKGSNGSRMGLVVKSLEEKFATPMEGSKG